MIAIAGIPIAFFLGVALGLVTGISVTVHNLRRENRLKEKGSE